MAWIKAIISGLLAGAISFGSGIAVAIQTLPQDTPLSGVPALVWITIASAALVSAAKDWQSNLSQSPTKQQKENQL